MSTSNLINKETTGSQKLIICQQELINCLISKIETLESRMAELESRTLVKDYYLTRAQVSKLVQLSKRTIKDNPAFKAIELPIENTNRVLYSIEDLQILIEGC